MATAGIILGRNLLFHWDSVQVDHLTKADLKIDTETIDLTSYDSANWKDMTVGDNGWSVTISAYVAYDATEGYVTMLADQVARTSKTVLLSTEVVGDATFTGTGFITSISKSGDQGGAVTFDVTISGTGVPTFGTVSA